MRGGILFLLASDKKKTDLIRHTNPKKIPKDILGVLQMHILKT